MRDFLRSLPVFAGVMGDFDADAVPDDPAELFGSWLRDAVREGVPEPHAMTLSTTDASGAPDAERRLAASHGEEGWTRTLLWP